MPVRELSCELQRHAVLLGTIETKNPLSVNTSFSLLSAELVLSLVD